MLACVLACACASACARLAGAGVSCPSVIGTRGKAARVLVLRHHNNRGDADASVPSRGFVRMPTELQRRGKREPLRADSRLTTKPAKQHDKSIASRASKQANERMHGEGNAMPQQLGVGARASLRQATRESESESVNHQCECEGAQQSQ